MPAATSQRRVVPGGPLPLVRGREHEPRDTELRVVFRAVRGELRGGAGVLRAPEEGGHRDGVQVDDGVLLEDPHLREHRHRP